MAEKSPAGHWTDDVDWLMSAPFLLIHAVVIVGVFLVPFSWPAFAAGVALYFLRMFGITAGFHRYFAHRGFKTGRVFQFILALLGTLASQKGVLWWSGHHRHHHKRSDLEGDVHSPKDGVFWSHMGWVMSSKWEDTPDAQLREFAKYPELLWLNRWWYVPPVALGVVTWLVGGWIALFWTFAVSTVLLYQATFCINSMAHLWGSRRYQTTDTSRNNLLLALMTMGEGWHNNHHHYQSTANNGFFWWEVDLSYAILKVLSWFGVVWDLRTPPKWVLEGRARKDDDRFSALVPERQAAALTRARARGAVETVVGRAEAGSTAGADASATRPSAA
jgi:stearoyl-CoA desaturase (delta-9 desaturase)